MRLLHWAKRLNDDGLMADEDWVKLSQREKNEYEDYLFYSSLNDMAKYTIKTAGKAAVYCLGFIGGFLGILKE